MAVEGVTTLLIPTPLTVPIQVAELALQLFEITGLIPDPLSWLFGLFGGRPTMAATHDEATIFLSRQSPSLRLLGAGAAICLQRAVPLSSPDAGPLFGPYFAAAVIVENAIRWGSQDASLSSVDAQTLSAAMTEAGGSSDAYQGTMAAIDQAWAELPTKPQNAYALGYLTYWSGSRPEDALIRAVGQKYLEYNPAAIAGGTGPVQPPAGTAPYTPPAPPAGSTPASTAPLTIEQYLATHTLPSDEVAWINQQKFTQTADPATWATFLNQWWPPAKAGFDKANPTTVPGYTPPAPVNEIIVGQANGAIVRGTVDIIATFVGAAYPTANAYFYVDGKEFGEQPAHTNEPEQAVNVSQPLNTTTLSNGTHTLRIAWVGERGTIHSEVTSTIVVDNTVQPPPPPAPPPAPPPPPESPASYAWFNPCTEAVDCKSLTDDGLAVAQQMLNIAHAALTLPAAIGASIQAGPTAALIAEMERLKASLDSMAARIPPAANLAPLTTEVTCLCDQLQAIARAVSGTTPDLTGITTAIASLAPLLKEIAAKINPVDLSAVADPLNKANADRQVPESWIQALIKNESIPPEFAQLIQGTTWEQVLAEAAHILGDVWKFGHAHTWGEIPNVYEKIVKPLLMSIPAVAADLWTAFSKSSGLKQDETAKFATDAAEWVDAILTYVVGKPIGEMIQLYEADIAKIDTATVAGVNQATEVLMSRSLAFGVVAHCIAFLAELPFFNKLMGFKELAALVAEFSGFKEVIVQSHRPFLYASLGRPASHAMNREYPNALPPVAESMLWWARRLLPTANSVDLMRANGFGPDWDNVMHEAAYRPISAFVLRNLYNDRPVNVPQLTAVLQDSGMSPQNVQFMVDSIEYSSVQTVRNAYVAELQTAYGAGVVSEQEMHDALNGLGWSDQAKQFILNRGALVRRVNLAKKVEAQVIPLVAQGSITPQEGEQQLEAAGIQPWYGNLEITLATTKAEIHQAKLEAAAERKAQIQTQRDLTRAAVAEFKAGRIGTTGLSAALTALGLTPSLTASIVAVEEASLVPKQVYIYGMTLSKDDAKLLAERISTIEQQTKDQLVTLDSARSQLQALKIPANDIAALISRWAATLKKSPGSAVLVNPLTGQVE
jgi:hypothetical protein